MSAKPRELSVGRDSVVIGDVTGNVGDGSVVIGPTDNHGNVILDQPMAVGRGAFAGSGSIAIGAFAGAGNDELLSLLARLRSAVQSSGNEASVAQVDELTATLQGANGQPSYQRALTILGLLRDAATIDGVVSLVDRIRSMVELFV
jgi:hypothetical protein